MSNKTPKPSTSPWARTSDSTVHGRGLTATKDVPKGTRVIEYVGDKITKAESDCRDELRRARREKGEDCCVYIFELDQTYDIDGDVAWNTARLINHSCDPNCKPEYAEGGIWITARRDIAQGEELNYDYGFDWENYDEHACRCGAPTCCGYIIDKSHRWRVRKFIAEKAGKKVKGKKKPLANPLAKLKWADLMRLKARFEIDPKRSLAIAESLTCGQLQSRVGLIPGASNFFRGGMTTYTIDAKVELLGVNRGTAEACNAVSETVAKQMARGVVQKFGATVGVATTGYAEPDDQQRVEVPFAYWAIVQKGPRGTWVETTGVVKGKGLIRAAMQAKVADKVIAQLVETLKLPDGESQS